MEQILLEALSKHMKDEKVVANSQCGFTNGKVFLTKVKVFYDEITGSIDKGRKAAVVYLDFSNRPRLIAKLVK